MANNSKNYVCWDCGWLVKENQKTCKKCWAELVWNKWDERNYKPWFVLMSFSWVILTWIWLLTWDSYTIWLLFVLSIPLTILWLVLRLRKIKFSLYNTWDYIKENWRGFLSPILLILLIPYNPIDIGWKIVSFILAIKRYIIWVIGILLVIYLLVKFIKRSWKH